MSAEEPEPAETVRRPATLRCRIFGCAWAFHAEGELLVWRCARGCPSHGARRYPSAADARRMARALERGRPGPPEAFLRALAGSAGRSRRRG